MKRGTWTTTELNKMVLRQQVYRWRVSEDMSLHKIQGWARYFNMTLEEFLGLDNE